MFAKQAAAFLKMEEALLPTTYSGQYSPHIVVVGGIGVLLTVPPSAVWARPLSLEQRCRGVACAVDLYNYYLLSYLIMV